MGLPSTQQLSPAASTYLHAPNGNSLGLLLAGGWPVLIILGRWVRRSPEVALSFREEQDLLGHVAVENWAQRALPGGRVYSRDV